MTMKRTTRWLTALGCTALLTAAAPAGAQTLLTLNDAIAEAIAGNPSLRATRAAHDGAAADARAARAEWFPRITFSEGWQRSTDPVAAFGTRLKAGQFAAEDFGIARLNHPAAFNGFSRRVGVSGILFDSGRTRAAVRGANQDASIAEARVSAAEAALAIDVTVMYGRYVSASAAVDAANAALAWATEDLARASSRRQAGTATDADVFAMSVHVADTRQRLITAQGDVVIARAALNQLMGAPLDRVFTATLPAVPSGAPELKALIDEAHRQRPELREAGAALAAAEARAEFARAGWWPAIGADAGYEWTGLDFSSRQSAWSVGAELRWSLSTGGAEAAQAASARAGVARARASRDAAISAIGADVITAVEAVRAAGARIAVSAASAVEARERLRIVRERYAAGLASVTDVLAAAAASAAADASETANHVAAVTAWAALQRASGQPVVFRP
ncbi:MAG: TolC family protein [Acidobacteria bacterium]|nr:MAG: TolC family protein [Acidobacteriota bacterium]